jgi:mRNA interferase RelE/StbE
LSEYRVFETEEFLRSLGRLPEAEGSFVRAKLSRLAYPQLREMPFFGPNVRKLRGYSPETWRYRVGNYRVFFHVDDTEKIVFVLSVDKRKDAYR